MAILRRLWSIVRIVLISIGALYLLISFTPVTRIWLNWLAADWNGNTGDVLVVLHGPPQVDDLVGAETYWRIIYAVRAMRERNYKRVIFVGAGTSPAAVRRFVAGHGLPLDKLEFETESRSTHENARNAAALLKGEKGRIALLTSDYHSRRAGRAFTKAGVKVFTCPSPDAIKTYNYWYLRWNLLPTLVSETGKLAYYWYKNWI